MNGDGFDDIVIGTSSIESYVVFGGAGPFTASLDLAALDGMNGFRIDTVNTAITSVSSAGDVNGDGFDDIIIGSPFASGSGGSGSGESYVVFGKASGYSPSFSLATLDGRNGFRLDGVDGGDQSGFSVSSAGDVNGDGIDDLVIGMLGIGLGDQGEGESYVVFGRAPTEAVTRVGAAGDQTIRGGAFDDQLDGLGGDDVLFGGGGADILNGGSGNDTLDGGAGNDILTGGPGLDTFDGGDDIDTVDYTGNTVASTVDLIARTAAFSGGGVETFQNVENFLLGSGNDTVIGDGENNRFEGNAGADTLDGGAGLDTLVGGADNDIYYVDQQTDVVVEDAGEGTDFIYTSSSYQLALNAERLIAIEGEAGAVGLTARNFYNNIIVGNSDTNVFIDQFGRDTFVGGGGADYFRFIANLDPVNNVNRINDFNSADDQIQLQQTIYSQIDVGILDASQFVLGTAAIDADDRIIYDSANGVLFYDPDGTGATAQIEIVNVVAGTTITADDFQIF